MTEARSPIEDDGNVKYLEDFKDKMGHMTVKS